MESAAEFKDGGSKGAGLAWTGTLLASVYFFWTAHHLRHFAQVMGNTYGTMGVELPLPTRLSMFLPLHVIPLVLVLIVAFSIGKELLLPDKRMTLAITLFTVLAVNIGASVIEASYLLPFEQLMEQLGR